MTRAAFRRWSLVHTWTSVASTIFLLVICITGLPLLYKEEIFDLLDDSQAYAALPENTPALSLDALIQKGRTLFPGEVVVAVSIDDDEPNAIVSMASSWEAYKQNIAARHWIKFDTRTADVLKQSKPYGADGLTFLMVVFNLHKELFAGFVGELFVGMMGLLLAISLISGAVLYGPFMRKLDFGTVRHHRSARLRWLDLHNLLGIATLLWLLVVSSTGFINALSKPLFAFWQKTDVATLLASYNAQEVKESSLKSAQTAMIKAQALLPTMQTVSVVFPGSQFGSPVHYVIWMKGKEPLTSRLFSPVLVHAQTGELEGVVNMPWYLRALELSRPLHFGDYGGGPLKVIWAIFDLVAIIVLISGLYLWWDRRFSRTDVFGSE